MKCAVTRDEISTFRRDWDRVVGSIGREDHRTYTTPFVREVSTLSDKAGSCPGADNLQVMKAAATKIDSAAATGEPDYKLVNEFAKAGNSWLEALGYGSGLLGTS